MNNALKVVLIGAAAAMMVVLLPDIRRYIRISTM